MSGQKAAPVKAAKEATHTPAETRFSRPETGMLLVHLAGDWRLQQTLPSAAEVQPHLDADPPVQRLAFDAQDLTNWDSGLLTFLRRVADLCLQRHIALDQAGLAGRGA
jgi:phospholipid/cholesterol/gamma-HCH transport system permease protein